MSLTNEDLQKIANLLSLTKVELKEYIDQKLDKVPTVEQFDTLRDQILTELRKVRTEQEFIRVEVYDDLDPRVTFLEDK